MSFRRYASVVVAAAAGSLLLLWPWLLSPLDALSRWAALLGTALATLNTLAAYLLVLWSARRSNAAFLRANLGGMLARMAFMLAAVPLAIREWGLPSLPLVVSLLGYFVLFLVLELAVVSRRVSFQPEAR